MVCYQVLRLEKELETLKLVQSSIFKIFSYILVNGAKRTGQDDDRFFCYQFQRSKGQDYIPDLLWQYCNYLELF